jgi:hypothetical protein
MISHWIAVIVLFLVVAGGMALAWPRRKKMSGLGADVDGPGPSIDGGDHHHSGGDGFSAHD